MSSPLGHALAGYAVGVLVAGRADPGGRFPARTRDRVVLFAGLACLPDVDFLFNAHSMYTHSIGAVLAVGAAAAAFRRPPRVILACIAAYGSHLLLDYLGNDTVPPIGIMAQWPFDSGYYQTPRPWFLPVSRRYWLPGFWRYNFKVVSIEIALFGGLALAAHYLTGAHRRRRQESTPDA